MCVTRCERYEVAGEHLLLSTEEEKMAYYRQLTDLPEGVRNNLPQHAQEIYRAAFNNAWEQYARDEERAHRVAWAAVKEKYEKSEKTGTWKKKG
jgi:cation transport regulator